MQAESSSAAEPAAPRIEEKPSEEVHLLQTAAAALTGATVHMVAAAGGAGRTRGVLAAGRRMAPSGPRRQRRRAMRIGPRGQP